MTTSELQDGMRRFGWLLRREWMQHHRGWLILAVVPLALALLVVPAATIEIDDDIPMLSVQLLTAAVVHAYLAVTLLLALAVVWLQAPGLARRDQQDRSIEFWLSLPNGHSASVLATVLMHLLLMPLMVLLIAFVSAQLVAVMAVVRLMGLSAPTQLDLPAWLANNGLVVLRMLAGLLIAVLWSAPLVLLGMAASAWLKRWGVPALVAGIGLGSVVVQQITGSNLIWRTAVGWFEQASQALVPRRIEFKHAMFEPGNSTEAYRQWLMQDLGQVVESLASPQLAAAVVFALLGFGLLVLRRAGGSNVFGLALRRR